MGGGRKNRAREQSEERENMAISSQAWYNGRKSGRAA